MKKVIAIICFIVLVMIPIGVYGEEENKSNIMISFELTAEDRFIYEVRVSGGGYLVDGSQKITNGIMEYELSVGQKKEFNLEAKRGYEIKEIRNNGKALEIQGDRIEIAGVSARSILEVKYEKIEEPIVPDPEIPDIPDKPDVPDIPSPPDNTNPPDGSQNGGIIDTGNLGNGIDHLMPITGDMLRISEYVCLMLIVLYRIYVSSNRRDINTIERDDNIAISRDIGKEETKEEKKDEK